MTKPDPSFNVNFGKLNKLWNKDREEKPIPPKTVVVIECIWETCQLPYSLPLITNLRAMTIAIDHSTCPNCGRDRCPNLHDKSIVRCSANCPLPAMKGGMCIAHYMKDYKRRRKVSRK